MTAQQLLGLSFSNPQMAMQDALDAMNDLMDKGNTTMSPKAKAAVATAALKLSTRQSEHMFILYHNPIRTVKQSTAKLGNLIQLLPLSYQNQPNNAKKIACAPKAGAHPDV